MAANAAATGAAEQSKAAANEAIAKTILNLSPQVGKAIEEAAGNPTRKMNVSCWEHLMNWGDA